MSVILPVAAVAAAGTLFYVFASSSSAAPAAAAAPNPNCTMIVPANPLTATGLSTPYQLTATSAAGGPCNEANAAQSAFVEASIIDPATGAVSVYRPLVIDKGTKPAAAEVVPTLPANAVVALWTGFNGTTLTLQATNNSLQQGQCVSGLQGSPFGQVAACNAPAFFQTANKAIAAGQLTIPALATAKDGQPCPTTRDFGLIDQDQSDNVVTSYLATGNGTTAQNTAANTAALAGATPLVNGSDNLLLDGFVDPALGCTPFTAPDLTNPGQQVGSLALDELQAAADQKAPIALVPLNDPMTLNNNNQSRTKTNLFRVNVDQPPLAAADTPTSYCQNMVTISQQRTQLDKALTMNGPSPAPANANNLFTFLAMRLNQSFTNLGCGALLKMADPVTLQMNGNGVVIGATFAAAGAAPPVCGQPTSSSAAPTSMSATGTVAATGTASATATASATGSASATGTATATATGAPGSSAAGGAPVSGTATATGTMSAPATSATSSVTMTPSTTGSAPAGTTTTAPTCMSTPPATTKPNHDMWAGWHARHHPHKY